MRGRASVLVLLGKASTGAGAAGHHPPRHGAHDDHGGGHEVKRHNVRPRSVAIQVQHAHHDYGIDFGSAKARLQVSDARARKHAGQLERQISKDSSRDIRDREERRKRATIILIIRMQKPIIAH